MGRRRAAVASVTTDSSPSSSSFRELDDAFLQTQTRIWLGEVLSMRLDEDVHISDLLADGELLYEVSKTVWNKLLTKCAELWHLKANLKGPLLSRKSSGRYMPYSNVDSFLKICKILGLNGIDFLSPSDVVERKNTRKVCICIRALSKKARSKQLQVPDFDIVTYTVAMPTDMVGCIRRSLESSQSSISSCSSNSPHIQSTSKLRQIKSNLGRHTNDDSCSEESDEAESNYMGADSHCSTINKLPNAAATHFNSESSPGAYSSTKGKQYTAMQCASSYVTENQDASEFGNGQYESQKISGSVNSTVKNSKNDQLVHSISFSHADSGSKPHDRAPYLNGVIQRNQSKSAPNFDLACRNVDLVTRDSLGDSAAERDYISEYLAFSDSVVFGVDGSSPVLPDGEDNSYNFFMGIDSRGSIYENGNQRKDSDIDDEVSSTTSMSSVLGRVLIMELDDKPDLDDSSATKDYFKGMLEIEPEENRDKEGSVMLCETQAINEYKIPSHGFSSDARGHIFGTEVEKLGSSLEFIQAGHYEKLPVLESQDKEFFSGPPQNLGEDSCLKGDELFVAVKDKESVRDEDTERVIIGSNMFVSDVNCEKCASAQILADKDNGFSDTRPGDSSSSRNVCSVDGNERWCCSLDHQDGVTRHVSNHDTPETIEVSHKTVVCNSLDILPSECVLLEEAQPCPSTKYLDSASKEDKNYKDTNELESISDLGKDTTDGLSRDKPRQKLLKTVAKGTAIIGVLFLLLQVRRRSGDKDGKASKKSGQIQNIRHAEFSSQGGSKGGSRGNSIYPAEKLKI